MRNKHIHGIILQLKVKAENYWQQISFFSLSNKAASQPSIWQMSTQSLGWDHNTLLGASASDVVIVLILWKATVGLCSYFSSGQRLCLSVALYKFWVGRFAEANLLSNHPRILWFKP